MTVRIQNKSELRRQHYFVAALLNGASHKLFIVPGAVAIRCVQKIASQIKRMKDRSRCLDWIGGPVRIRQSETTQSYWANLRSVRS